MTRVESIMTEKIVTVDMDESFLAISEIFENAKIHHLLVVEHGKLRGVISDRDFLKVSSPFLETDSRQRRDVLILKKRAHQVMSRDPVTVRRDAHIDEATRRLLDSGVSCLPVVCSEGKVEGVVTWRDLLRHYLQDLPDL